MAGVCIGSVVDGIVGAMGEGVLKPHAREAGVLADGFNPVAVDTVCTGLMGFDFRRVLKTRCTAERDWLPLAQLTLDDLRIFTTLVCWWNIFESDEPGVEFIPSAGWQGHIEAGRDREEASS